MHNLIFLLKKLKREILKNVHTAFISFTTKQCYKCLQKGHQMQNSVLHVNVSYSCDTPTLQQ